MKISRLAKLNSLGFLNTVNTRLGEAPLKVLRGLAGTPKTVQEEAGPLERSPLRFLQLLEGSPVEGRPSVCNGMFSIDLCGAESSYYVHLARAAEVICTSKGIE